MVDQPAEGEFFGFASMLDQTAHQTEAVAIEESVCLEVDRTISPLFCNANRMPEWTC